MKLFVHIGTNKTGSSYLQSTITLNKLTLLKLGVFVPDSKWDESMLAGVITPGNGHALAKLLADSDAEQKLNAYFAKLYKDAHQGNCTKVVLSNEVIIRLFSDSSILSVFEKSALSSGFTELNLLVYIRNIYEHALSLYKHRAKFGKHADYDGWFAQDYETLRLIKPFLANIHNSSCSVTFVPYEKDSKVILQHFSNWLAIESHKMKNFENKVNRSLTLNQINWVRIVGQNNDGLSEKIYNVLIHCADSPENSFLLEKFYDSASNFFRHHEDTIHAIQQCVGHSSDYQINQIPNFKTENYSKNSNILTIDEFDRIQQVSRKYRRWYRLNSFTDTIRQQFRILKFKFLGKRKNNLDTQKFGGSLRN